MPETVPMLRRPKPPKLSQDQGDVQQDAVEKAKTVKTNRSGPKAYQGSATQYHGDVRVDKELKIHSLHPKGPPAFPPGKVIRGTCPFLGATFMDFLENFPGKEKPLQASGDLTTALAELEETPVGEFDPTQYSVMPNKLKSAVVSRQNYQKLTSWFVTQVPRQDTLHTVNVTAELVEKEPRVPIQQTLIELRSLIEEALQDERLRFNSSSPQATKPRPSTVLAKEREEQSKRWKILAADRRALIHGSRSRYFCGEGRAASPFESCDQDVATPSEVAVLESMMHGGYMLSLKAHFIPSLPDLSPLSHTLVYLNLSFNDLKVFPSTVLELKQLVCLKMRNNPLKEIPNDISKLQRLEILCLSFNLLSSVPPGLYKLESLVELDLSNNNLQWLSNDIRQLRCLRKLHLQGNELAGLPSTAAELQSLKAVNVANNFMHPLLWREMTRNQPQRLFDMCLTRVERCVRSRSDARLPQEVRTWLTRFSDKCEFCCRPLFGSGQRLIRAQPECPHPMRDLPFIFTLCSAHCRQLLKERAII